MKYWKERNSYIGLSEDREGERKSDKRGKRGREGAPEEEGENKFSPVATHIRKDFPMWQSLERLAYLTLPRVNHQHFMGNNDIHIPYFQNIGRGIGTQANYDAMKIKLSFEWAYFQLFYKNFEIINQWYSCSMYAPSADYIVSILVTMDIYKRPYDSIHICNQWCS